MLDQRFYWGTTRKAIVAFGNMFNGITIDRKDSTGTSVESLRIPLSYVPKQKFLARIQQQPSLDDRPVQVVLPRMSFEMTGLTYDSARKISPLQQNRSINSTSTSLDAQYAPTPYNIQVSLYVYAKNQDDGLQIIEQIIPYFNPDYNLTMKTIPEMGIKNDLPILLEGITFEDTYEGNFADRRSIIWTLSFMMKLNYYGPVNKQGIIKKVVTNTYSNETLTNKQSTVIVEPDPRTAKPTDNFGYINTFEDF
jgi:hypothetical protein